MSYNGEVTFRVIDYFFLTIFTFEFMLRERVFGLRKLLLGWKDKMLLLDSFIVVVGWATEIVFPLMF